MAEPRAYDQGDVEAVNLRRVLEGYYGVVLRGWRLIVISVVLCLTLAALYLAATPRLYESSARLLVIQQGGRPLNVAGNDPSQVADRSDDYIPTHVLLISSPIVVRRAIDSVGLNNLPTLADAGRRGLDPVKTAIDQLSVDRPDRLAKILRVRYWSLSRAESNRTVKALAESYQAFLEEGFQKKNNEAIVLISKARDELSKELTDLQNKYREFRERHQTLTTDASGRSFISTRIEHLYRTANDARVKAIHLKSQLELGKRLSAEGAGLWAIAYAIEQVSPSASGSLVANAAGVGQGSSLDYIRQLSQEQQKLAERHGPQNAKVQDIKEQIDRIRLETRNVKQQIERGEVHDLLAALDFSMKSTEDMRKEIHEELDRDLGAAKGIENDLLVEANLRDNIDRQRSLFNTVVNQLKQVQFVNDYSTITSQIIDPPVALVGRVQPRRGLTMLGALAAGCLLGMAAAVVADHMDQRVRSLDEIRKIFDLPMLGQVFKFPAEKLGAGNGSAGLIAFDMPRSIWAEAYRTTRTNLDFLRRNRRVQVVLVTSASSGDGKSTTSSNLAISLAQAGRKVLLIDADLRRPTQYKIHNIERGRGLTHLLKDLQPFHRVVQKSVIEGLDLVASGPEVSNPSELLASVRTAEVFEQIRGEYEVVIIDSPPILAVTDTSILSAIVDGIILVVNPTSLKHYEAQQTKDALSSLGSPVLGVVVNGIDNSFINRGFGYGYGSRYGYGYGYGYGMKVYGENGQHASEEAVGKASDQGT